MRQILFGGAFVLLSGVFTFGLLLYRPRKKKVSEKQDEV